MIAVSGPGRARRRAIPGGPPCGPLQQSFDVSPERLPRFAFILKQFGQFLRFADAREVGVLLPVFEGLNDDRTSLRRAGFVKL